VGIFLQQFFSPKWKQKNGKSRKKVEISKVFLIEDCLKLRSYGDIGCEVTGCW